MINCLIVGLGGAIGSVLRYLVGLIPIKENYNFPIKTFLINVIGCLIIGFASAYFVKVNSSNEKIELFLKAGICGGFTTFSSFALENTNLLKTANYGISILYISLSLICGICAIYFAHYITSKM